MRSQAEPGTETKLRIQPMVIVRSTEYTVLSTKY